MKFPIVRFMITVMSFAAFHGLAHASVEDVFQKAVQNKECQTVRSKFPELLKRSDIYYLTLSKFHFEGFCFERDVEKSFLYLTQSPEDDHGYKDFQRALYYLNGWGVQKDEKKAKILFDQAMASQFLLVDQVSEIRQSIEIMLQGRPLPNILDEKIKFIEEKHWDASQKYEFAVDFIQANESSKKQEIAYAFLAKLSNHYDHGLSAFELAKYHENLDQIEKAKVHYLIAARRGVSAAQAQVGRKHFFEKSMIYSDRVAFQMLYLGFKAGKVSEEELKTAEASLDPIEVQFAKDDAHAYLNSK